MSIKNKLLVAFLFTGILPSFCLGFYLFYKSYTEIENLTYKNMAQHMELLEVKILGGGEIDTPDKVIVLRNNEAKDGISKEYPAINQLDKTPHFYDASKGIKITKYRDEVWSALYSDKGFTIYFAENIHNNNPWINEMGTVIIKVFLVIITLSIGISLIISNNIVGKIQQLMQYITKVEKGKLDFVIPTKNHDEIDFLTHGFNKMVFRLNRLINETYKLQLSEKEANLKALQAQISPHFLYNALDTINWSLIEKGDYETSEVLGSLSQILRYSINFEKSLVCIWEEFDQVQNYLRIQKNRFEDRFDYSIQLDDQLRDYHIPKLLLQPLVENAVIHGVEKFQEGGLITVSCTQVREDIVISVEDNGNGIKEEELLEIHRLMNQEQVCGDHIGLVNVNERVKLLYGEDYSLSIESSNQGTIAKINISMLK